MYILYKEKQTVEATHQNIENSVIRFLLILFVVSYDTALFLV